MEGRGNMVVTVARALIMALFITVCLGYIFIWAILPTELYETDWQIKVIMATMSTYFGSTQGATILIYTFPILFIAVLGCIYLQLGKGNTFKHIGSNGEADDKLAVFKKPMRILRKPIIMKWLGIVSMIELAFLAMFIGLLIWSYCCLNKVSFDQISAETAAEEGEEVWESKLDKASLNVGITGGIVLAFLFYPVTRGSSILPMFGLTSESSIKYHIWLGHIVMTLFTVHGVLFIIYWAVTNQMSEMLAWANVGQSMIAGEISLICGLFMWVTTIPRIRRKMFEIFFYTHYLYIPFMFFYVLHVGIAYSCLMLPGFYLFVVDRFLRFLQSQRKIRLVSARILPGESVELNLSKTKDLKYTPTSILFVQVPSISKLQWHPFTISSSSALEPETLSVTIKGEGSWTKKLHSMISSSNFSVDSLDVSVEGPYGPASIDFLRHDTLVMVSGGSGVTPFISIIKELISVKQTLGASTPKVILVSSFRNSSDLSMLNILLPVSSTPALVSVLDINIQAFVTREKKSETKIASAIQTKWFKPNANDQPLSPALGPYSWLWLGLIISSSFVFYLLFMGILTRYYIYPIDHNSDEIFSYSARASLSMLFMCVCIAITASFGFYWNKLKNQREINQSRITEAEIHGDTELESLPQESIFQSTTVHYGERPDLKKILLNVDGSSIGVLTCGPKKMRHEVAKVCSSGAANNLHFESISFSW